jgi:hypothetical protein
LKEKFNKSGNRGRGRHTPTKNMSRYKLVRRKPEVYASFDVSPSSTTNITSTGSQTYTVPRGVDTLTITMYGGGGGGGLASSGRSGTIKGGGGGGGSRLVITLNEIAGGTVLTFGVGVGGAVSVNSLSNSSNGVATTLSYGGIDYVAGGGEGNRSGGAGSADGTGGAGDCDSGPVCTATAGNNGTAYTTGLSTAAGGPSLETANSSGAGAGGAGSNNASSQNAAAGVAGKVVIS